MGKHEPTTEMLVARSILDTIVDLMDHHRVNHDSKYGGDLTGEQYTRIAISAHIDVSRHPTRRRD